MLPPPDCVRGYHCKSGDKCDGTAKEAEKRLKMKTLLGFVKLSE